MRGKATHVVSDFRLSRITPACAGKRVGPGRAFPRGWDHPRVCGEKSIICWVVVTPIGSPPRVRGKVERGDNKDGCTGITPACAGKSAPLDFLNRTHQDHPRVCGEKDIAQRLACPGLGSPPRVRGKAAPRPAAPVRPRITPACAGKSHRPSIRGGWSWDHPRVCGEKSAASTWPS